MKESLRKKYLKCMHRKKEFERSIQSLYACVLDELEKFDSRALSKQLGKEGSYVSQTIGRGIQEDVSPTNFVPFMRIVRKIIDAKEKREAMDRI